MEELASHSCDAGYTTTYVDGGDEDGKPVHFEITTCNACGSRFEYKRPGPPPPPEP